MSTDSPVHPPKTEDTEQTNNELRDCSKDMFDKISNLLVGELRAATEDYVLLEQMNAVTTQKYAEMAGTAESLTEFMTQLRDKCKLNLSGRS